MNKIITTTLILTSLFILFSCDNIIRNSDSIDTTKLSVTYTEQEEQVPQKDSFISQLSDLRRERDETEYKNELGFDTLKNINPDAVHILKLYGLEELNGFFELSSTLSSLEKLSVINVPMNRSIFDTLMVKLEDKPHLKKLMIHHCDLKTLPPTITKLKKLETFISFYNPLAQLPAEIGLMNNLREIDIHNATQLKILPPEIGELKQLEKLSISGSIKAIPAEIGNCKSLWYFGIGGAQLKTLPSEIGLCTNLTHLSLASNKIITLPKEIGNLSKLDNLNLMYNQLSELPTSFTKLKKLTFCGLAHNQFKAFPKEVLEMDNLITLWIHKNPLTTIPTELGDLKNLKYLMADTEKMNTSDLEKLIDKKPQLSVRNAKSKKIY